MSPPRPIGLLLAAGQGRRMGGSNKQLLPWPPDSTQTMIEASFDCIAPCCEAMFVVLGHQASAVAGALAPRIYIPVTGSAEAPMFDSLSAGLRAIVASASDAPILLHLADCPAVSQETIRHILQAGQENRTRAVVPRCDGRGGHPVLIPPEMVEQILVADGTDGLRGFWRAEPSRRCYIDVQDAAVGMDADTQACYQDLERFRKSSPRRP